MIIPSSGAMKCILCMFLSILYPSSGLNFCPVDLWLCHVIMLVKKDMIGLYVPLIKDALSITAILSLSMCM